LVGFERRTSAVDRLVPFVLVSGTVGGVIGIAAIVRWGRAIDVLVVVVVVRTVIVAVRQAADRWPLVLLVVVFEVAVVAALAAFATFMVTPTREPVAIAVFVAITDPVVIGIAVERVEPVLVLSPIEHAVVIGVGVVRIGVERQFLGIGETVRVGVDIGGRVATDGPAEGQDN